MKYLKWISIVLTTIVVCFTSEAQIRYRFLKNDKSLDNRQLVNEIDWLDRTVIFIDGDYVSKSSTTATYVKYNDNNLVFRSTGSIVVYGGEIHTTEDTHAHFWKIYVTSFNYCSMGYYLNGSSVTDIPVANQYELICGTGTLLVGSWFQTATDKNGNSNRLVYVGEDTRRFRVDVAINIRQADAGATRVMSTIYKNGTRCSCNRVAASTINAQNDETELFMAYSVSLATNDYIEVYVTTIDADSVKVGTMFVDIEEIH